MWQRCLPMIADGSRTVLTQWLTPSSESRRTQERVSSLPATKHSLRFAVRPPPGASAAGSGSAGR